MAAVAASVMTSLDATVVTVALPQTAELDEGILSRAWWILVLLYQWTQLAVSRST